MNEELKSRLNLTSVNNTFELFVSNEENANALKLFKEMADKPLWYMLLSCGKTGCGKTHLCEALAIELAGKGIYARVFEWAEQVRLFKKTMRSDIKGQYDQLFENLGDALF